LIKNIVVRVGKVGRETEIAKEVLALGATRMGETRCKWNNCRLAVRT